jgi:hypothetical protein
MDVKERPLNDFLFFISSMTRGRKWFLLIVI